MQSRSASTGVRWPPKARHLSSRLNGISGDDSVLRYTCLRASEIGFRDELLECLSIAENDAADPNRQPAKLAQMVFCIDVRSERIRRHLNRYPDEIETFGFAGFFGMPIEFVPMGETCGNSPCARLAEAAIPIAGRIA